MNKLAHISFVFALWLVAAVSAFAQDIVFDCKKSNWATIGNQEGEIVGTLTLTGHDMFDHFEAEIRCNEDAEQYITFANCRTNGGNLICYTWEGGKYDLNKGYHYTITIRAFDVPYYGWSPVKTLTYDFVGTGVKAPEYSKVTVAKVNLPENNMMYHGYVFNSSSFNVEFSEPVSRVEVVWEQLRTEPIELETTKKDSEGRLWSIKTSDIFLNSGEMASLLIRAWDMKGMQMRGESNHGYPVNLISGVPTSIDESVLGGTATKGTMFNIAGQRISSKPQNGIYIVNGKKFSVK